MGSCKMSGKKEILFILLLAICSIRTQELKQKENFDSILEKFGFSGISSNTALLSTGENLSSSSNLKREAAPATSNRKGITKSDPEDSALAALFKLAGTPTEAPTIIAPTRTPQIRPTTSFGRPRKPYRKKTE